MRAPIKTEEGMQRGRKGSPQVGRVSCTSWLGGWIPVEKMVPTDSLWREDGVWKS